MSPISMLTRLVLMSAAAVSGGFNNLSPREYLLETAQRASEYVLIRQGSEILSVRIATMGSRTATGVVTLAGDSAAFEATASGSRFEFTTTAPNGSAIQWGAEVQGDRMTLTLSAGGASEQHVLTRRGLGWSDTTPLAKRWTATLQGRAILQSTSTTGGSFGGATSRTAIEFCPGNVAVMESNSVVSIAVPGAGGSQTGRESVRGRWRVVTNDDVAGLELISELGRYQLGIRTGDGSTIYLAEQLMRLGTASRCN